MRSLGAKVYWVIVLFLPLLLSADPAPDGSPAIFTSLEEQLALNQWEQKDKDTHFEELEKKYGSLAEQEIKRAATSAQKAHQQRNYDLEVSERERIVGHDAQNFADVYALTVARALSLSSTSYNYSDQRAFLFEASQAYTLARTHAEKIRALFLLIVSKVLPGTEDAQTTAWLAQLSKLTSLQELRTQFPELKAVFLPVYKRYTLNTHESHPSVDFVFSHAIDPTIKAADYIKVMPEQDVAFTIKDSTITVRGLQYGQKYRFSIRPGLKTAFGEFIEKAEEIEFYLPDMDPRISLPTQGYVLQKNEHPYLPISTINASKLKLTVKQVTERAMPTLCESLFSPDTYAYIFENKKTARVIFEGDYEIAASNKDANRNTTITTNLDLQDIIKTDTPGVYTVVAQTDPSLLESSVFSSRQWVVISDLGITTFKGRDGLTVNVRSLTNAKALEAVEVKLLSKANDVLATQTTNTEGFVFFEHALLTGRHNDEAVLITVYDKETQDFSFIKLNQPAFDLTDRGVSGRHLSSTADAFLYSDRGVYRNTEVVHLNILLRDFDARAVADSPLKIKILRPDGVVTSETTLQGNALGHYSLDWTVPEKARTGYWTVEAYVDPKAPPVGSLRFQVEDFVPTRLLMELKTQDESALLQQGNREFSVYARYLFGAKAPYLQGKAFLNLSKHPNPFPAFQAFSFGLAEETFIDQDTDLGEFKLNEDGKGGFKARLPESLTTSHALQARVSSTLTDSVGKSRHVSHKLTAMCTPHLLGLKPTFAPGTLSPDVGDAEFEVIAVDTQGKLVELANIHYTLVKEDVHYAWSQSKNTYKWEYHPVVNDQVISEGILTTSAAEPVRFQVPVADWGTHRLIVKNTSSGAVSSYRFSKGYTSSPEGNVSPHRLVVSVDKPAYALDETIKVHIDSPFEGEGMVVVANQKVVETHALTLQKGSNTLSLKMDASWGRGAYILAHGFRPLHAQSASKDPSGTQTALLPKRAIGLTWAGLDATPRRLEVKLSLPTEMRPKHTLRIPLEVTGSTTDTLHVTVAAIDEGILQLTDYHTPDPFTHFFGKTKLGVDIFDLYGHIIEPLEGQTGVIRSGGDIDALSRNLSALSKRSFKTVSLYQGDVTLDDQGKGEVSFEIPDFQGQLRLMAVAFNQNQMGSTQEHVTVRNPLVVDTALPRFLTHGDTIKLPIALYNLSGGTQKVSVTLTPEGNLSLPEDARHISPFEILDQKETLLFVPLEAVTPGDGALTITVTTETGEKFEERQEISVKYGALKHANYITKLLKPGETFQITPAHFSEGIIETLEGNLRLSDTLPWHPLRVAEGVLHFRYSCAEQISSRILALLVLSALDETRREESLRKVNHLIGELGQKQDASGGFKMWAFSPLDPWITTFVGYTLQQAKRAGADVSPVLYQSTLKNIREHFSHLPLKPNPSSLQVYAFALYVLAQEGEVKPSEVRYFFDMFYEHLPNFYKAQLIALLSQSNDAKRFAQALDHFNDPLPETLKISSYEHLGSKLRNHAGAYTFLLEAAKNQPDNTALAALTTATLELIGSLRPHLPTLSTNEGVWLALAGQTFQSAHPSSLHLEIDSQNVELKEDFLHRITPDYASKDHHIKNLTDHTVWLTLHSSAIPRDGSVPLNSHMTLTRKIFDLHGKEMTLPTLKHGENYIVVLEGALEKKTKEAHVLVTDNIAAGFSIDNISLNPLNDISLNTLPAWLDSLSMLDHREMRDDHFAAALTLKDAETFKIAYVIKATTQGSFKYLPAVAVDMYKPRWQAQTADNQIHVTE